MRDKKGNKNRKNITETEGSYIISYREDELIEKISSSLDYSQEELELNEEEVERLSAGPIVSNRRQGVYCKFLGSCLDRYTMLVKWMQWSSCLDRYTMLVKWILWSEGVYCKFLSSCLDRYTMLALSECSEVLV